MDYDTIRYAVRDHILTITLNRPEKLNAFSSQMMLDLIDAIDHADDDDDVRAIIVTGEGRGFCAGMNLSGGIGTFDYLKLAHRARTPGSPIGPDGEIDWRHDAIRDAAGSRRWRDHPARHGHPHRIQYSTLRLCIQPARHSTRGLLELVPAAHRGYQPGAGMVAVGAGLQCTGGACRRTTELSHGLSLEVDDIVERHRTWGDFVHVNSRSRALCRALRS
jgi:hypothetical protein